MSETETTINEETTEEIPEDVKEELKTEVEVKVDEEALKEALKEKEENKEEGRTRFFPEDDVYIASIEMMNFNFEKAKKELEKTMNYCPMSMLLYGETLHVRSWATQSHKDKEEVITYVTKAETLATTILKNDKNVLDYIKKRCNKENITKREVMNWKAYLNIIVADSLLSKAINQLQTNSLIYAAWNMKKAWNIYDGVMKSHTVKGESILHSEINTHLKFGVGLFYYIISLVPGVMLKVLTLIGFVADQDKGIQYMQEVYKLDNLKAPYASIILLASYLFLPSALSDMHKNLENCKPCVEWCHKTYPKGAIFSYFSAQFYRKLGDGKKAIEELEQAIVICEELKIPPNLFNWDLANCHFMCLEWEKAAKVLEKILSSTSKKKDFEFNSLCTLQLACSLQLMGEEKKAQAILKKVPESVTKKGRYDKMALRKAQSILNLNSEDMGTAMYSTAFELLYFKRDIAHMLEEHLKQVQSHMEKISGKVDLKKIKKEQMAAIASCLVIEGAVWRGLKDNDKAKATFLKALTMESTIPALEGRHWMVGALYELGELSYREGKLKEAEDYLNRASKYSGYDWEDVYKSRLQKALSQLKKEIKSEDKKKNEENVKKE